MQTEAEAAAYICSCCLTVVQWLSLISSIHLALQPFVRHADEGGGLLLSVAAAAPMFRSGYP